MKKFKTKKSYVLLLAAAVAIAVVSCVNIWKFDVLQYTEEHPEGTLVVNAGDEVTFVTTGDIQCHENHENVQFVIAYLVPKSWNVTKYGKVTYKCDLAEDHEELYNMSLIPASSLPKNGNGRTWVECLTQEYGVGTNVLDDMEWVVYQTDDKYDIINNQFPTYTIYLTTKAGPKNLRCHMGVFVNHTDDGFGGGNDHKKCMISADDFQVVNGEGMMLDYCYNHYNKVSPMSALQDDFVTITYNGKVSPHPINDGGEVYLQGTAYTAEGGVYNLTAKDASTKMRRESEYDDIYTITRWPAQLFQIPAGEEIVRIEYFFSNRDGSITVTQSDDDLAISNIALPAIKQPFVFVLECE